jgi:dihydrofolate synthase/folylpolyglutamate synthase
MPTRVNTRRTVPRRRAEVSPKPGFSGPVAKRPVARSPIARSPVVKAIPTEPAVKPAVGGVNSYARAIRFLNTLSDYERLRIVRYNNDTFNLDRMRLLLRKLSNPQDRYRSVHIAGTKGKGSTCAMVAGMLQACGYKVGLYTSPHLVDIRERIQINGEMISQADFARMARLVEPIVAHSKPVPSYFDALTAMAFKYFAERKIDIAIVETGLGGRLDSTNVINPEVTAITSISKDHMAQLGPTLRHIAAEKAGIFKQGVPAVSVIQNPEAEAVLKSVAEKVGAPLDICGSTIEFSYRFESSRMLGPHNRVCLNTPNSKFEHLAVPMIGEHQAINCGLALCIIDKLKGRGIAINDARAMEGLAKVSVPGRMEMLSQTPRVIADGAHNAASLDALMRAIGQHIPYDSMVLIFGCCADKDVAGMLDRITSGADKVIFTYVDNVRSADPHELASRYIELYGKMAQVAETLDDALSIANRAVTKEDLICITGSFYLVGEAKRNFAAKAALAKMQA